MDPLAPPKGLEGGVFSWICPAHCLCSVLGQSYDPLSHDMIPISGSMAKANFACVWLFGEYPVSPCCIRHSEDRPH